MLLTILENWPQKTNKENLDVFSESKKSLELGDQNIYTWLKLLQARYSKNGCMWTKRKLFQEEEAEAPVNSAGGLKAQESSQVPA